MTLIFMIYTDKFDKNKHGIIASKISVIICSISVVSVQTYRTLMASVYGIKISGYLLNQRHPRSNLF